MKLSVPNIIDSDINSVKEVLKSGWISTSSKKVNEFEKRLSKFCNTKHALALNSGTSAIHLGLKILGVDQNCEVIVPSTTFIATVNPILYLGANPIIFDVDQSHNLNIKDVIHFINNNTIFKKNSTINKKTKKIIKVIIIAHMWGNPCNFSKLKKLCKKRKIYLLEDAAEALGSYNRVNSNKLRHCGSIGDIGCLSFNANKIITTGSGGAILTNNKEFYKKAEYLSTQAKDDTFNYIHEQCGYNYKMNGINAALGISQLKRIKQKIALRKKIHQRYIYNFRDSKNIKILPFKGKSLANYWINIASFKGFSFAETYKLSLKLLEKKIETRRIWRPLNFQSYLKKYETYKVAESPKFYSNSLCIPSNDNLSLLEVDKISKHIKESYNFIK